MRQPRDWTKAETEKIAELREESGSHFYIAHKMELPVHMIRMKLREMYNDDHKTRPPLSKREFALRWEDFKRRSLARQESCLDAKQKI